MEEASKGSGIFCDKCNVYVPNEASLAGHLKGKKHVKNIERIKKLESEAERSLYISGFSSYPGAIELSLADYFSKYGSVAKITVDKNHGRFAILEFSEVEPVKKVLQEREHFLGSTPIIVKPRDVKLPAAKNSSVDQRNIVHTQMHPDVWKALMGAADVSSQFVVLQSKLSLTDDEKHLRNLICKLLETAFEDIFTSCEIQPFGSSVNGFGVHGCDLDLNFKYESIHYDAAIQFLPENYEEKTDLNQNTSSPKKMDVKQVLSVIASIIKQCVPDCDQVKAILNARRPVVKFHHKSSKMCCDISIGNSLAVRNTLFLRCLSEQIPYLSPLVQAVRLWMKHWKIAASNHSARSTLNNYAVTLLVLFYLYQKNQIYTLDEIRATEKDSQPCIIENWNCSFSETSSFMKETDPSSLSELFAGFFHFYNKFEFAKNILCLKSGKCETIESSASGEEKSLPKVSEPSKRCFKIGALNIRDPFELNHNVAGNVGQKHMLMMTKCIRNAVLATGMKLYNKKQGGTNSKEPWGILNLFVDHHNKKLPGVSSRKISSGDRNDLSIKLNCRTDGRSGGELASLVVTILSDVFFIEIDQNNDTEVNGTVNQVDSRIELPETVTHTINYDEEKKTTPDKNLTSPESRKRHHDESPVSNKRSKICVTTPEALNINTRATRQGVQYDYNLPITYKCESRYRVWEGRRKARRHLVLPGMSDLLDLERQISKLLVSESLTDECVTDNGTSANIKDSVKTFFCFTLTMSESENDTLCLDFKYLPSDCRVASRNSEQDFNNFFHHLEISLPNIIGKCLAV